MPHKLLQQEFSLGNFLNSIQVGILFLNEQYSIESPNKACSKIFGCTVEELENSSFLSLLSKTSKKTFNKMFDDLINTKGNTDSDVFELKVINKQGNEIMVELNVNSTLTASDKLYIIVINDISRRKHLEKEIEIQIEDKEEIIDELEKAQELSELKSRFVTMASHEFRTPLAGVLSSLNLVQRYMNAEEKEGIQFNHKAKMENHFNKIRESVGNLTQILNEFLSVGKLEEGKVQCQWESVNVKELIDSFPEDFHRISKSDQEIVTSINVTQETYILDPGMVRNVSNNIISNAIKYSDAGSKIYVSLTQLEDKLKLVVKDEGYGIPKEDHNKLFGRFFRAKNATNIQGTGLGLNIVKKYVEMMGGTISFQSELNKGSTFTVLLPVKNEI